MSIKIQSDEDIKENALKQFRGMLVQKPFAERWEPIRKEMEWVIKGCQNEPEHQRILPAYCYNIFELYDRTLFKVFPACSEIVVITDKGLAATAKTVAEAKQCLTIDWEKLGIVLGIGIRGYRFLDVEIEEKLREEDLLDFKEDGYDDLLKLLISPNWRGQKTQEIQTQQPNKPVNEAVEKELTTLEENINTAIPKWNRLAYGWGPEAIIGLNRGMAMGAGGFVDEKGELKGDRKLQLKETYGFLLLAWPEIQQMMVATPPKTRNDLWDWLAPFSYAKWVEVEDLEQLNRLCDSIKLKLKAPGPPHKAK